MKLVIAEKPSVAQSLAAVLGASERKAGYLEGGGWLVSWCIGHLVRLAPADAYDPRYSQWDYADLPILPKQWQYTVDPGKKEQFEVLSRLMVRPDVDGLVCATDAGREGELIFRLVYSHDDRSETRNAEMADHMVMQALAPYYNSDTRVKDAVDSGLKVLKKMQEEPGGFSSYGTYNAESTAQVIVALTALGIDPTSEEWTQKYGNPVDALLRFYNSEKAKFRHIANGADDQMASEQSAYALVAYRRFVTNQNRLYDMRDAFSGDDVGTDPVKTIALAKVELGTLGKLAIPMTTANTPDEVKSYITDVWLKMLTTKGPEYTVKMLLPEEGYYGGFTAARAGTESSRKEALVALLQK